MGKATNNNYTQYSSSLILQASHCSVAFLSITFSMYKAIRSELLRPHHIWGNWVLGRSNLPKVTQVVSAVKPELRRSDPRAHIPVSELTEWQRHKGVQASLGKSNDGSLASWEAGWSGSQPRPSRGLCHAGRSQVIACGKQCKGVVCPKPSLSLLTVSAREAVLLKLQLP